MVVVALLGDATATDPPETRRICGGRVRRAGGACRRAGRRCIAAAVIGCRVRAGAGDGMSADVLEVFGGW